MKTKLNLIAGLVAATLATPALATNGYFSHGYGVKSQGIGGVGIALPQDTLAAATNPAGLGLVGDRADVGLTWFRPDREAKLSNTFGGTGAFDGKFEGNNRDNFLIPEAGFNKAISPDVTLGVSIYGNGGMNTDYEKPITLLNGGSGKASGINYAQLFVAPTLSWKVAPGHTLGLSVNLGYQRFEAKGIDGFKGISAYPNNVTGRGVDDAYGIGLHLGWIGQISDSVTLGATYQSRTNFQEFDKYKGLFAGAMDAPASYGVGIAVKATPQLTVAADVQRILFSDVDPIGNSISKWNGQPFLTGAAGNLGKSSGPGFGWEDATVFKIGSSYAYSDSLTLRAGYDHVTQPVPKREALFNILAPAVVQDHISLGATWILPNKGEVSFGYTHAFEDSVNGTNAIPAQFGGGNVKLKMHQDSLGVAYGWAL